MSVTVVDRLEAVEVGERERDRAAEALGPHQLAGQRLLAVAPVGEAGEHVHERLPRDDPVQAGVLERDRGVGDQGRGASPLVDGEAAPRKRERAEALAAGGQRQLEVLAPVGDRAGLNHLTAEADDEAAGRSGRLDHGLDDHA